VNRVESPDVLAGGSDKPPLRPRVGPFGSWVVVLALVVGTGYAVYDTTRDDAPPRPLALEAPPGSAAAGVGTRAGSPAAGPPEQSGRYVLDGTLPAARPGEGTVYRLPPGTPDADALNRLAGALGLDGPAERRDGDVVVRSGSSGLWVSAAPGMRWSYVASGLHNCPVSTGGQPTGRRIPLPPGCPRLPLVPDPDSAERQVRSASRPVSEGRALSAATPVLSALGLDPAAADTRVGDGGSEVRVAPPVEGLPTVGWDTVVTVGVQGVVAAHGWLGPPQAGDRYPVVEAPTAFQALASRREPAEVSACDRQGADGPDGRPWTPDCPPLVHRVTGATFGLTLAWEQRRPLLVPAWVFAVAGSPVPVAQVAVAPRYLA